MVVGRKLAGFQVDLRQGIHHHLRNYELVRVMGTADVELCRPG